VNPAAPTPPTTANPRGTEPHDSLGHDHVHDHGHDDHGEGDAYHATLRGYVTGFVLAVILTAIPFWLVMTRAIASPGLTTLVILVLGAVQIVVHMVYFLHVDAKSQGGWNLLALLFTLGLLVIMMVGSIWVMYHMDTNMMTMPPDLQHQR
jgi:cytochrome o ubiquinol oxidase operon protein cyoD